MLAATLTQTLLTVKPQFVEQTYRASLKVEGFIVEGNGPKNTLNCLLSSEHLKDSPAFVFIAHWEKVKNQDGFTHRLQVTLNPVECTYNKVFIGLH